MTLPAILAGYRYVELVFLLLIAHAFTDFAFQTAAMAKGKNRHRKPDYIPEGQTPVQVWFYYLTAHALINAGGVYVVTGSATVAVLEFVVHWLLDFAKGENWTNPHGDQLAHFAFKILWAVMVVMS
jgi:hypothetical protein